VYIYKVNKANDLTDNNMTISKNTTFTDVTDSYITLTATGKVIKGRNHTQADMNHEFKMTFKNPYTAPMMVIRSESYISDYMTQSI
jgi:hypothetical protein